MIASAKSKLKRHKGIIANLSYLTMLKIFNILLPLVTYPYLIKVLGASIYGEIIFAQTVCYYFVMLVDFGLNISSTKEISIHRDHPIKLSEITSAVYIIKIVLWLISIGILLLSICFVSYLSEHKWLYIFSFMLCFNELLFPQWFFQGIEKMGYLTFTNLCTRILLLICIFVFIHSEEDFLLVPLFNGIGALFGGIIGLYILYKYEHIRFIKPSIQFIKQIAKDGFMLYLSDLVISVKDRLSVLFIGMFLGMHQVAIFDLAIKIMNIFNLPIGIINNAIYPKVVKEKNMQFVKKIVKYTTLLIAAVILLVQPFLGPIINHFVPSLIDGLFFVRVFMIIPILFVPSVCMARNVYIAQGHYKLLLVGMILTTVFYLLCIGICASMNLLGKVEMFVYITLLVYLFELIYRIYALKFIR